MKVKYFISIVESKGKRWNRDYDHERSLWSDKFGRNDQINHDIRATEKTGTGFAGPPSVCFIAAIFRTGLMAPFISRELSCSQLVQNCPVEEVDGDTRRVPKAD